MNVYYKLRNKPSSSKCANLQRLYLVAKAVTNFSSSNKNDYYYHFITTISIHSLIELLLYLAGYVETYLGYSDHCKNTNVMYSTAMVLLEDDSIFQELGGTAKKIVGCSQMCDKIVIR